MSKTENKFHMPGATIGNQIVGDNAQATAHMNVTTRGATVQSQPSGVTPSPPLQSPSVPILAPPREPRSEDSASKFAIAIAGLLSAASVLLGALALVKESLVPANLKFFGLELATSSVAIVLVALGIVGFSSTVFALQAKPKTRRSRSGDN